MRDTKQPLDLSALENDYDIIGELGGPEGARTWFGTKRDANTKRRDDNSGVLVEVLDPPAGDEGNALSHFASDAQILMRLTHRRLIPVIEARWVGKDVLAMITKRTTEPTLAQLLSTGETFTNPRAAAILRELNGLLEWAREQKIVHRTITPDRIYLEPRTDRVRASFAVAPIPRVQRMSAADQDARTIATLAMAMLTGNIDPASDEGESLAELRPDLPEQLVEETAALLSGAAKDVDVPAYLALVGMADPLAAGETEAERIRAEVLEEQRLEREKLASERAAFVREMEREREKLAKEAEDMRRSLAIEGENLRAKFQADREALENKYATDEKTLQRKYETDEEELRSKFVTAEETLRKKYETDEESLRRAVADERAKMERAVEEERARLLKERTELVAAATAERAAMTAKRAELERAVAEQRAALERAAAEDRERIAALRAEIERRGELEVEKKRDTALEEISDEESTLDDVELATPVFVPPIISPLGELQFEDTPLLHDEDVEPMPLFPEPARIEPTPAVIAAVPDEPVRTLITPRAKSEKPDRTRWMVPAGLAGLVVIAAISAGLISSRRSSTPAPVRPATPAARTAVAPAPAPPPAPAPVQATPVVATPPRMEPAAWAAVLADSVAARAWLDSLKHVYPTDVPWAVDIARARMARAERARAAADRGAAAARASATPATNAATSDSLSTPPGTRAVRSDTVMRRDTGARRDTNAARPDTAPTPPPVPPI